MLTRKDALRILGLTEASLTEDSLKSAWKISAKKFHPDVSDLPDAEHKFKLAREAFELLSSGSNAGSFDWEEFAEQRVREAKKVRKRSKLVRPSERVVKPEPLHLGNITLPLECFLLHEPFDLNITITAACLSCYESPDHWIECLICEQTGYLYHYDSIYAVKEKKCPQCAGEGWIRVRRCEECLGALKVPKNIKITHDLSDKKLYRFPLNIKILKKGNQGWNCDSGDIFFKVYPKILPLELSPEEGQELKELLHKKDKVENDN